MFERKSLKIAESCAHISRESVIFQLIVLSDCGKFVKPVSKPTKSNVFQVSSPCSDWKAVSKSTAHEAKNNFRVTCSLFRILDEQEENIQFPKTPLKVPFLLLITFAFHCSSSSIYHKNSFF